MKATAGGVRAGPFVDPIVDVVWVEIRAWVAQILRILVKRQSPLKIELLGVRSRGRLVAPRQIVRPLQEVLVEVWIARGHAIVDAEV